MRTTNSADNSAILAVEILISFAASEFCWISNLLNSARLSSVYLEYQLKCYVHTKGCVKIFIYCRVHKVYSNGRVKFILYFLSFIPFCRLKLTATTYKNSKVFITRGHFTGVTFRNQSGYYFVKFMNDITFKIFVHISLVQIVNYYQNIMKDFLIIC